jgi:hypothetical protein
VEAYAEAHAAARASRRPTSAGTFAVVNTSAADGTYDWPAQELFSMPLLVDVVRARAELKTCTESAADPLADTQSARRGFVRAAFAMLEGEAYVHRQAALSLHRQLASMNRGCLTDDEVLCLQEKTPVLDRHGEADSRPAWLRSRAVFRWSLEVFAKAMEHPVELPWTEDDAGATTRAIAVRDGLMHPKTPSDLLVTDGGLCAVEDVLAWRKRAGDAYEKARQSKREPPV